ncbi:DUF4843 domain-containing protein [Chitinophaga nivalis]|uniref:DUF4843 domain-containing protein n=1 Tax=Chitinophaga nivalis TaxID=2991709 RepID=A0ABT3ITR0_9BACT|nr:DUF4843 domain-containing protein [Chitinophaga nivalis]MCW3463029.1 DUF4843 domain-containing protein [Chitinophaga nivalis]MCW3487281.1 DUF4843 domain-containing protein [Chitinophaga nivalis]
MKVFLLYVTILAGLMTGCSKSELMRYQGENNVYFSYPGSGSNNYDTIQINFAFRKTAADDTARFYVKLMGRTAPENRSFSMLTDEAQTTAVAGKHYRLPGSDSLIIPAGSNQKQVLVKILRPADLYEKSCTLFLKLVPNNNFETNMPVYNPAAANVISAINLRIIISDQLPEPDNWAANTTALGTFSRKKLTLFAANRSLVLTRFYTGSIYTATQLKNFAKQFQTYLNDQQKAGNTIREEDGTEMKMGPSVQ